jgi:hypothetical protein
MLTYGKCRKDRIIATALLASRFLEFGDCMMAWMTALLVQL